MEKETHVCPHGCCAFGCCGGRKAKLFLSIIALIVVLGFAWYWFSPMIWPRYVAVYANTGDLYFGKLVRFPHTGLADAWYMQKDGSGSVSLSQFSKAVWEPKGDMDLNTDQIVWIAPLKKGTRVYAALMNGGVLYEPQQELPFQGGSQIFQNNPPANSPEISPFPVGTSTPQAQKPR